MKEVELNTSEYIEPAGVTQFAIGASQSVQA